MKVSIVIPAHNEERLLPRCLASVIAAAAHYSGSVEIIVVCNRCSDRTEAIAASFGCICLPDDSRCLAQIRNRGVARATGDIIITIDADSWMTSGIIESVAQKLNSGRYIGGGAHIRPERMSLGIFCSLLVVSPFVIIRRVSAGLFWCLKTDFDAIGGFDESLVSVEDLDFAVRLKRYGKQHGRAFGTLRRDFIWTSCRKFDHFGDWFFVKNPGLVLAIFTGKDRAASDQFYYDFKDKSAE